MVQIVHTYCTSIRHLKRLTFLLVLRTFFPVYCRIHSHISSMAVLFESVYQIMTQMHASCNGLYDGEQRLLSIIIHYYFTLPYCTTGKNVRSASTKISTFRCRIEVQYVCTICTVPSLNYVNKLKYNNIKKKKSWRPW